MKVLAVKVGLVIAAIVGAFFLGKSQGPAQVEVNNNTQENRDVTVTTREVIKPDGTVVKTSKTKDKTRIDSEQSTKITNKPNWKVSALIGLDMDKTTLYGAAVDRRILGSFSVGVWGLTNKTAGVSVGMEF